MTVSNTDEYAGALRSGHQHADRIVELLRDPDRVQDAIDVVHRLRKSTTPEYAAWVLDMANTTAALERDQEVRDVNARIQAHGTFLKATEGKPHG
ncbi:hypothetical protein PU630_07735 [Microbacterium horticulturae]|uniref:Uncharacterized protein n=1 Tax=Microbacterium horticulturae TaxID=3028316 RepID=A0ABY8C2U6_9MICO|nr:hypothetical protein [Microbacterium sp. KACC 23027]WEG10422.1 hypothetical protein PU630_07735 [Microbacterium sp. KACC 23027]